jgi:hypothetical protein
MSPRGLTVFLFDRSVKRFPALCAAAPQHKMSQGRENTDIDLAAQGLVTNP